MKTRFITLLIAMTVIIGSATAQTKVINIYKGDDVLYSLSVNEIDSIKFEKEEVPASNIHNGYAYVDLGLSVKWATCNVGATTPEEYGNYFAWGETETKTTYDWSTYKYCNGIDDSMTKYCIDSESGTVDNKTTLELSDDAANVNWGGNWRIPTKAEQDELRDTNNCTWEWTTQNGVNGYKVTSKKNGNSIFLPAAGYRFDFFFDLAGSYGYYWSSSLNTSNSHSAYFVGFRSDHEGMGSSVDRYLGYSVRAVFAETYTVSVSTPDEAMGTAEVSKSNVENGESVTLTATPNIDYIFKYWTLNGNIISTEATYTATITSDSEFIANFEPQPTLNGHEYVDLGLPSGIKWATCNVGATTPEEYGDYFAWGETETKATYAWNTYKYCNGSYNTLTKYCTSSSYGTVDNKTTLELSDDAARANWGGNWRMPTKAEYDELMDSNNCTWEWTTQNGVNGYKVTSKKNGNSIFLSAAGFSSFYFVGSLGYYWSSSLSTSESYLTYSLDFGSDGVNWYNDGRYYGRPVRAVFAKTYTVLVSTSDEAMGTAAVSKSNVENGESVTLTATPNSGYNFKNWTLNGDIISTEATYTANITSDSKFIANFEPQPTLNNGHAYVDLGLPSGIKWATCNVGATTPEEYGDYFALGETEAKTTYDWSTYKYCNGTQTSMTKYCTNSSYGTVDNKTTLELSDDAAHVNWGGDWRMPTQAEQDELRDTNNCTWEWTTQNGVNGYKVTSKKNGNSIFLPAAGYRSNSSLNAAGVEGAYWSSSLSTFTSYNGYQVLINSGNVSVSAIARFCGQSVRAVFAEKQTYTVSVSTSGEAMGTAEVSKSNVESGESVTLTATPNSGYNFKNWTLNGDIISTEATYTATITSDSEFIANFELQPTHNGYAYVDLGLSVKWATCNVGATTPEEYGDYFAWGETETKTTYNWDSYKYCNGDEYSMTKYCTESGYGTVDNKTTLELSDDAAHVNWGGDWRMPTKEEQDELRNKNNCTWEWTTQNGVNGYKVTSKKNGNSIFLPAAGYRSNSNYSGTGSYWSSSLRTGMSSNAYNVRFDSGSVDWSYGNRASGRSVRAVFK